MSSSPKVTVSCSPFHRPRTRCVLPSLSRNRLSEGYCGLPVRVRAGLHAGEALRHENDFYGRTVVIAARISALALGNEILTSDLVHTLAVELGTFSFVEPRVTALKGLEGSFTVYPVLA